MTSSIAGLDDDRQFVRLEFEGPAEESIRATVTVEIPESQWLELPSAAETTLSDGTLTIEQTVEAGTTHEIGYVVGGPTELSEPQVSSAPAAESEPSTRVEWVDADGDRLPLSVTVDTVAEASEPLPLVTASETPSAMAPSPLEGAAVGVILTPSNEDAVLRTVLRASRRGHPVFVTTCGIEDEEPLDMLASLGSVVLSPPSKWASQLQLHRLLSQAARTHGATGIVLQTRDCPRIDYEKTGVVFEKVDYEVIAIPELWNQSPDNPEVVVGIPAYNAGESIAAVVERALPYAAEVVVVDDGSRDETAERAREAGATVVVHERNRGYGGALKTLFQEAASREAAHLVVIDADGQHDPADIPTLVQTQSRDESDIVIGSRYVGERDTRIPFVRSLGLSVINNLTNASLGKLRPSGFIRDTQSGYRAYSLPATRSLASDPSIGNNMGASTDILYHAHRNRLSVSEVGTTISYDVENASSQGSLSHGMDLVRNIFWTVEYGRPLLILGTPGAAMTLLGVAFSVLLLGQYVETGFLAPVQLGLTVLFTLAGLLICITSLMMHVLNGHPTLKRIAAGDNS